jgi:hypothetical protein
MMCQLPVGDFVSMPLQTSVRAVEGAGSFIEDWQRPIKESKARILKLFIPRAFSVIYAPNAL